MVSDRADDHDSHNLVPVRGSGNLTGEVILAEGQSPSDEPGGWRYPVKRFPGRENQETPAYGTLWQSLQRRWLMALVVGLVLGCAAAATTWVIRPANYTAFALVRIESERPELLPQNHPRNDVDVYRMTQAALIKSPKVLDSA